MLTANALGSQFIPNIAEIILDYYYPKFIRITYDKLWIHFPTGLVSKILSDFEKLGADELNALERVIICYENTSETSFPSTITHEDFNKYLTDNKLNTRDIWDFKMELLSGSCDLFKFDQKYPIFYTCNSCGDVSTIIHIFKFNKSVKNLTLYGDAIKHIKNMVSNYMLRNSSYLGRPYEPMNKNTFMYHLVIALRS